MTRSPIELFWTAKKNNVFKVVNKYVRNQCHDLSIITTIRLETLYPKNAVIDRLRSKYAFEDKIICGEGGQGHLEENRTERYSSQLKVKP